MAAETLDIERPCDIDTEVLGLDLGQLGPPHPEGGKVQTGDLLVQVLGQHIDLVPVLPGLVHNSI